MLALDDSDKALMVLTGDADDVGGAGIDGVGMAEDDFFRRYHSHEVEACPLFGFMVADILPLRLLVKWDLKKAGEDKRRRFFVLLPPVPFSHGSIIISAPLPIE